MNKQHNILIVDANVQDRQSVELLLKRSLTGLSHASMSITHASSLAEAKNKVMTEQFTLITLAGEFPGFVNNFFGHDALPFIKEYQKNSKIIMISGDETLVHRGLKKGADFGFQKQDICEDVKLNENFELISIN